MKTTAIIFLYIAIGAVIIAGFILQRKVNQISRINKETQCPKAGNTYEAWVVKRNGYVFLCRNRPYKLSSGDLLCGAVGDFMAIPPSLVPDLTFENSPQKVRLTIEKMEA